jgi:flagellar motor switch/type III secretory pathway protein FliN
VLERAQRRRAKAPARALRRQSWARYVGAQGATRGGQTDINASSGEKTAMSIDSAAVQRGSAAANEYQRADFQSLEAEGAPNEGRSQNLDLILDIPVTLSMEVGRAKISIRDLLQLSQGGLYPRKFAIFRANPL